MMMMGILLLAVFVVGCSGENKSDFILYVSDQSFDLSPVEIKVYIDDKLVINEDFEVGNQHNWNEFRFKLSPGSHTIKAVTAEGIILEKDFTIVARTYGVLNYWNASSVNKFTFDLHYDQPMFQ